MGKNCRFYVDLMAMHEEVTGSCNLVIVKFPDGETLRFVVDCGLFQEREYDELNSVLPFLTLVDKVSRNDVLADTAKKIIVTTSGMGSYGPAQIYIPEYISRKNALIQFTGYTAEGTMGNRLKNTEFGNMVEVGGLIVKKRADVEYTKEYSAHAKADEMIEFLKGFRNLKLVLVNHGEINAKKVFAERIVNEVDTKRVGLLGREYFFRVNSYGLVKTLSTKFK